MQKIDYLESKVNEILSEISYLAERCEALESKVNGDTEVSQASLNEEDSNN